MKKAKSGHGGARPGAGAPKKDPTTTLAYRVPLKWAAELDQKIRAILAQRKYKRPG